MERIKGGFPKLVGIVAVIAALGLGFAACGGDDSDEEGSAAAETEMNGEEAAGGDEQAAGGGEVVFEVPADYEGPEAGVPTSYEEPETCEGFTIGWQNPLRANESLDAQEQGTTFEVERLGGEVVSLDDQLDPNRQVSNMQQLLAQGVDAIGFFPIDPEATDPILERASEQNVPVLAIESDPDPEADLGNIDTQLLQGRDIQAYNQVSALAEERPGARIAIVGLAVPVPSLVYWAERAEHWAEEMGLEVVDTGVNQTDDIAGGEQVGNALLGSNPDLEGIIAYNDPTALGIGVAARGAGLTDLVIVGLNGGQDGLDAVEDGRLAATVQLDAVGMGVNAGRGLCVLANDPGAEVPNSILRPPTNAITSDNIDDASTWDEQLEELESE